MKKWGDFGLLQGHTKSAGRWIFVNPHKILDIFVISPAVRKLMQNRPQSIAGTHLHQTRNLSIRKPV
jgi:hypothetical protein